MKYTLPLLLLSAALTAALNGQTAAERVHQGDVAYRAFDDAGALVHYREALAVDANCYEALYKASRTLGDLADVLPAGGAGGPPGRMALYDEAVTLARRAVAVNPEDAWGHLQLASATGKRLLLLGKREQIDASRAVRDGIDRALALAPSNHFAHHAHGRWHRRMAEIGGVQRLVGGWLYGSIPKGSFEESEQSLRRAIAIEPGYLGHHLELGRTLVALGKREGAEASFRKCLELPRTTAKDDFYRNEARRELKGLGKP